jgi:hypothetical protein
MKPWRKYKGKRCVARKSQGYRNKKTNLEKNKLKEKETAVRQATKGEQEHSKFHDLQSYGSPVFEATIS